MKAKFLAVLGFTALGVLTSCDKELIAYQQGDVKIRIEKGEAWLHDFPLFMGIKKKNPPQIAVWIEDTAGNYMTTIYASHKIATESWMANGGNRRKEALPVWCFARGVQASDGLYLPTKKEPLVDGITGATPQESFDLKITPLGDLRQFVVKIELNHSTDWNDNYPENAKEGESNYSGGKGGSGQPAVVYAASVDLNLNQEEYTAVLMGHSSPDGSDGNIYPDISALTSALNMVKEIKINVR